MKRVLFQTDFRRLQICVFRRPYRWPGDVEAQTGVVLVLRPYR